MDMSRNPTKSERLAVLAERQHKTTIVGPTSKANIAKGV